MFLASPPIPQSRNLTGIQEATCPIPPQEEMEKSREREGLIFECEVEFQMLFSFFLLGMTIEQIFYSNQFELKINKLKINLRLLKNLQVFSYPSGVIYTIKLKNSFWRPLHALKELWDFLDQLLRSKCSFVQKNVCPSFCKLAFSPLPLRIQLVQDSYFYLQA